MRRLAVFNSISLDGYFTGPDGDLSWAYEGGDDSEFAEFTADNAQSGGWLVFGRKTYDMMKSFWPTEAAKQAMPKIAEGLTRNEKIVFSRAVHDSDWANTRFISGDPVETMREIKAGDGPGLTIMGSGSIIAPLAAAGLIDAIQVVVCPVVLGTGRSMFASMPVALRLNRIETRAFANGKMFIRYDVNNQ